MGIEELAGIVFVALAIYGAISLYVVDRWG